MPAYELVEVEQLGSLILRRLQEDPGLSSAVYGPWVSSRVTFPLRSLLLQASRNTRGAILLNLIVVAGGFATSGIAVASKAGGKSWIVFTIGIIVALAGAITQFFRPAFRATERTSLAVELREEGWAFATASGKYAGEVADVLPTFQAKVSDIHRRAARVSALDSTPPPASDGSGRQPRRRAKLPPTTSQPGSE